jgi:hypothetical protein
MSTIGSDGTSNFGLVSHAEVYDDGTGDSSQAKSNIYIQVFF